MALSTAGCMKRAQAFDWPSSFCPLTLIGCCRWPLDQQNER